MATEPKQATEDVKIDLFEDDDEFEEFEINEALSSAESSDPGLVVNVEGQEWEDKNEANEGTQQWEDDWDDDDVNDDFSLQLKRELESNNEKK